MKSLICIDANTLVTSPAMTFLQLVYTSEQGEPAGAPRASRAGGSPRKTRAKRPRDIEELALLGMELCGTYVLDDSWDGLTNTDSPLTSVAKIGRVLDARPNAAGVALARAALELVHDGSNSPMESVLCALMAWPRRLGGCGFGPVALNHRVTVAQGERFVDVAFPEHRVGLEYKGREYHSIEQVGRDDRRQNELVGSGWTIINVWYEDLAQPQLYDRLVREVARAMGVRLRSRSASFEARRELLRSRLLVSAG